MGSMGRIARKMSCHARKMSCGAGSQGIHCLHHANEVIGIWRTGNNCAAAGTRDSNCGPSMAHFISAKEFGKTIHQDGGVRGQVRSMRQGLCLQVDTQGLDVATPWKVSLVTGGRLRNSRGGRSKI